MLDKHPGDPCPHCATPLQKVRSRFRSIPGHVAECAHCGAAYELASEHREHKEHVEQPIAAFGWKLAPI